LGGKSVYAYLAALASVPCPLKITLQCSADKMTSDVMFSYTVFIPV